MTARTVLPPSPSDLAARFLVPAQRIVERCLAHSPGVDRRAAVLRLTVILGGGWHLLAGGELDGELDYEVRVLTRAFVTELDEASRGRLLQRMDGSEEIPGTEPSYFRVALVLEGAAWTVEVSAHARGAGATVGTVSGTLLEARDRALRLRPRRAAHGYL